MRYAISAAVAAAILVCGGASFGAAKGDKDAAADQRPIGKIVAEFSSDNPGERMDAARAAATKGKQIVPAMIEALKSSDWRVRRTATDALAEVGADAAAAVPALMTAMKDEKTWVRAGAAGALAKMGEAARPAIGLLVEAAGDPDEFLREDVMTAMNALCKKPDDEPQLLRAACAASMFPDTGYSVRRHTTAIIMKNARTSPEAKKAMIYMLNHPGQGMWGGSEYKFAEMLVEMGEADTAVPPVIKQLGSDSKGERRLAAATLGKFGDLAKPALGKLEDLAKNDPDKAVRQAAAEAVEKIKSGAKPDVGADKAKAKGKGKKKK